MANYAPILVAEDEETDGLLLRLALKDTGLPNNLVIARDGREAVSYLNGDPPYTDRVAHPLPGLLLLDLKMPRMDGFEVLAWMATRPKLQHIPVVVVSSSSEPSDMAKARELGARDYLVKPHGFRKLTQMFRDLGERWLREKEV
jgi:CheY-like chemotaxis protein